MTTDCKYERGKCSVCGRLMVSPRQLRACKTMTPTPRKLVADCPHSLGASGRHALLYGLGCASQAAQGCPVTVVECELQGECILTGRGRLIDETVKRCVGATPATTPAAKE